MNTNDPLATLFTNDVKAVDRQQLAKLVTPFIVIDEESKEFGFLPPFSELDSNASKIEILLAAAKARGIFLNEPDGLLPGEIIQMGIMATGSVKSTLKNLFDGHKIKKNKENQYVLPPYRISELLKKFISTNP